MFVQHKSLFKLLSQGLKYKPFDILNNKKQQIISSIQFSSIYNYFKMNQEPSVRFYNNDAQEQKPSENQEQQDGQMNYYNQYCRLFLANAVLSTQLKELNNQKNQLLSKLSRLQKKADQISQGNSGNLDQKKRRIRRSASEIARHYRCQVEGCTKSYGSEGSLNQHIKIKHPEIYGLVSHNMASSNHTVKQSQQESDQQS